jgi:hypothetical protein
VLCPQGASLQVSPLWSLDAPSSALCGAGYTGCCIRTSEKISSAGLWPFTLRSKPPQLAVPQTPVGLLPCRCPPTTRKKSPPEPTIACAPTPKHRRRSDGICHTRLFVGRCSCSWPCAGGQTASPLKTIPTAPERSCVSPSLRPMPLRLKSQALTYFLKGGLHLEAPHKPTNDQLWIGCEVGTKEGLGFKLLLWISDQHPTQRHGGQACAVPDCRV